MGTKAIGLLSFLFVFLSVISVGKLLTRRKEAIQERMTRLHDMSAQDSWEEDHEEGARGRRPAGLRIILTAAGRILEKRGIIKPIEEKLVRADIPLRGEEYLFLWLLSGLLPGLLGVLLNGRLASGVILSFIGLILPPLLVKRAEEKKIIKFNLQLVDALAILSNSLRASYSFHQSIELVSREMPAPLGKEFARTFREVNLGTPLEEALNNMGKRIASEDLQLIITAVLIQRQVGGNLAIILDNISETIRDRIRIQGEIRTLTAQGRISGLVIGCLPFIIVVILMLMNPKFLEPLFQSSMGIMLIIWGLVSEVIGIIFIRKITAIDY
ncbi:MAG TPA: type II secretion system F family protein [Peptococcaceae bacterium]|jgi:tight adherence protein B|nr:type II secretion system F family protein [Peptococcaceae bacterium]HPZ72116.1 type II secretion system F family protein [Peptococcaceae bacterium]HQD54193.1 type II secretion system F family protein [Peptococcaceae bacterium]